MKTLTLPALACLLPYSTILAQPPNDQAQLKWTAVGVDEILEATKIPDPPKPTARIADPDVVSLSQANRASACTVYQQLAKTEGNVFFSPYSISSALAMTAEGARGDTLAEMRNALQFKSPQEKIAATFGKINRALKPAADKNAPQLHIANALCQTRATVNEDYRKLLNDHYNAEIFSGDLNAINGWVKKQTQGKIDQILSALDPNSACVLLNAIYFKGDWATRFSESLTTTQPFHLADGKSVDVQMMKTEKQKHRLLWIPGAQILQMPYVGNSMSMVVILPSSKDGLADLEKQCTADNLNQWLDQLYQSHPISLELCFPKFKLETSYDLTSTCKALGINKAFNFDTADFSGILGKPGDLAISQIAHKAVIEVNEQGTEAAAATAVGIRSWSAEPDPIIFRADHPFLFLVHEHSTNSILFMGRLTNPKAD